jgi:hypothetical protein
MVPEFFLWRYNVKLQSDKKKITVAEAAWASYYSAALFVFGRFIKNSTTFTIFFRLFLRCQERGHLKSAPALSTCRTFFSGWTECGWFDFLPSKSKPLQKELSLFLFANLFHGWLQSKVEAFCNNFLYTNELLWTLSAIQLPWTGPWTLIHVEPLINLLRHSRTVWSYNNGRSEPLFHCQPLWRILLKEFQPKFKSDRTWHREPLKLLVEFWSLYW